MGIKVAEVEKIQCIKCARTMNPERFFTYKDRTKTEMCKNCMTMHVDNFAEDTYVWLLEKMDVPYVPQEWANIRDKIYAKDPKSLQSGSVLGKYLSKMKLKQFKEYGYNDSEELQKIYEIQDQAKKEAAEEIQQEAQERFENGEISEAEYNTLVSGVLKKEYAGASSIMGSATDVAELAGSVPAGLDPRFSEEDLFSGINLSDEEQLVLALKWGRFYQPAEWIELENIYEEMMQSFDVQDADTMNTLKFICKTNLKMNQALDAGDIDSFQKLSRVSESLRKSAKFTAAQNKKENEDNFDSVGELVALCERDGFIPRFELDFPQDKVDLTLKDMNDYLYKLVTEDLGFGQQIENSIKRIQIQKQLDEEFDAKRGDLDEDEEDYEDLFDTSEDEFELEDEDHQAFYENVQDQKQRDRELIAEEVED